MKRPRVAGVPIAWGLGHCCGSVALGLIGSQYMLFMTQFVGMSPGLVGAIFAFAKLSDVLSDVIVGLLSDRIDTRWGRRRPWLFAGALLLPISVVAIFHSDHVSAGWLGAASVGAILVMYVGYTCIHIPLVAMSAEITTSYKERGSLWAYGMFFQVLGNTTGIAGTPILLLLFGGGIGAYHATSLMLAGFMLLTGLICVIGTAKAPRPAALTSLIERVSPREWLSTLLSNGPLMAYAFFSTVSILSLSMMSVSMTFFLFDILKLGQPGMIVYGSAGLPGSILGLVLFMWLMKRVPKHILAGCAAFVDAFVVLGLRLLDHTTPLWFFGAVVFVWGLLVMGMNYMTNSLIPDIIRADTLKTGLRREGAIASLSSAIQKTMPAFSTLAFGMLLDAGGYIPGRVGAQPASAIEMIYVANCIIPGVLMLISSVAMLFFYNLTEEKLASLESEAAA